MQDADQNALSTVDMLFRFKITMFFPCVNETEKEKFIVLRLTCVIHPSFGLVCAHVGIMYRYYIMIVLYVEFSSMQFITFFIYIY
jgi:hypothetical protein